MVKLRKNRALMNAKYLKFFLDFMLALVFYNC